MFTIHMDPIETDNQEIEEARKMMKNILAQIDEQLSFHDFRMVSGPTHTNLIFDIVVPFECKLSFDDIRKQINDHLNQQKMCIRDRVQETLPEHCFWIAKDQLDTLPIVGAHRKWLDEGLADDAEASPDNPESVQISEASLTDPAETAGIEACQVSDASIMEKKKNKKKG